MPNKKQNNTGYIGAFMVAESFEVYENILHRIKFHIVAYHTVL